MNQQESWAEEVRSMVIAGKLEEAMDFLQSLEGLPTVLQDRLANLQRRQQSLAEERTGELITREAFEVDKNNISKAILGIVQEWKEASSSTATIRRKPPATAVSGRTFAGIAILLSLLGAGVYFFVNQTAVDQEVSPISTRSFTIKSQVLNAQDEGIPSCQIQLLLDSIHAGTAATDANGYFEIVVENELGKSVQINCQCQGHPPYSKESPISQMDEQNTLELAPIHLPVKQLPAATPLATPEGKTSKRSQETSPSQEEDKSPGIIMKDNNIGTVINNPSGPIKIDNSSQKSSDKQ
ncbi:MAG: hypothetical protein AAFV25_07220 [Bacteroidota bacterium]